MPLGGGLGRETAPIDTPMINKDKHQPVMPAPAPVEAPTQLKEQKRVIQLLESEQQVETNENGAELTPEQSVSPQGAESEKPDTMDMDNERPSTVQLEGEKDTEETLEKPTPSHPSDKGGYSERSYPLVMESSERHDSDGEPRERRCSDKVEERPDKVTPQTVNMHEEQTEIHCSSQIHRPTEGLIESHEQQKGHKHKTEGEEISDHPAQRLQARLAVATELLMEDHEFKVNEEARAAREKARIWLPKSYNDAINDPVYGSKWREAIHKELSALISFGTWNIIRRSKASGTIATTHWVFDVKLGPDGRIERFKARLVARGNEQSDDDFEETFAPVFQLDSLWILIALAARYGLLAHMLDASNAFVGLDLETSQTAWKYWRDSRILTQKQWRVWS